MVKSACHCGAVRINLEPAPTRVRDCNCSICRRYGALWAYTHNLQGKAIRQATVVQGAEALDAYIWGNRWSAVSRSKTCGCVMYGTAIDKPEIILSMNARMFVDFDPASVTIQRIDNAHTGRFWTRVDGEILRGVQPPMAKPSPEDWR